MPEGDTLRRTADGLRPFLIGRRVTDARARQPGPRAGLIVGATVDEVEAVGKNLIVRFDSGLELRTHLGMHGSWHRYRPGEPWRRPPSRARLVIEVPGAVAVCFDAPTVELLERRAEPFHPPLADLGPDLLSPAFDPAVALARLRSREREARPIGEALLDQRALSGIGNVYKSETLFLESVDPFAVVATLDDETLRRLVATARRLLLANADRRTRAARRTTDGCGAAALRDAGPTGGGGGGSARVIPRVQGALWVYARAGRPCRRCGAPIASMRSGERPRLTFWCPRCQAPARGGP